MNTRNSPLHRSPPRPLALTAAVALLGALAACGDNTGQDATGNDADSDTLATQGSDPSAGSMTDATTDGLTTMGPGGSESNSDSDSTTSGQSCPGQENACGGCDVLPQEPGGPCNGCDENAWTCDGTDNVVCAGDDPDAVDYWPDADGDGYGDDDVAPSGFCEPPGAGWVPNGDDCEDAEPDANPDGTEVCNGIDDDCDGATDEGPDGANCQDVCCDITQICNGVGCADKCQAGVLCGVDLDVCCEQGEICYANACVSPGDECEFDEECPIGQVCAPGVDQCIPSEAQPDCEFIPEFGPIEPTQGCKWKGVGQLNATWEDVVATPIVINLTDDNGDGLTNDEDSPEIAFLTYYFPNGCCNVAAVLRVVDGQCNDDKTMTTLASLADPQLTNDSGIAAGDLDGDGVPELVAITRVGNPQGTVAFKRVSDDGTQWEVLWHNTEYPTWNVHTRGGATISLADLEGDGEPEVIVGNVVLDGQSGALKWDGVVTSGGAGGIGNNGFLGPSSTVADLDLDGTQEVVAGNTVYAADGSVMWTYNYITQNSPCGGALPCDGFNAVANFDDDDEGEVAIIRLGEVFILDTDGSELYRIPLPSAGCANNESGPPTVADFDGDGFPEIGTASADYYVVADINDCLQNPLPAQCDSAGILWKTVNQDCSSRVTASSVFDFNGDESAEVVYADETHFRVYDGKTGTILYSDNSFRSHTRIEMPVIADVDNDGHAEVVVGENRWNGGNPGIEVWNDDEEWVRTRRVWNQHGYYITNIAKDGTIPAQPEANWLNPRFNNFRQNVQPGGLFWAPDADVASMVCSDSDQMENALDIQLAVKNIGAEVLPAGTTVHLDISKDGMLTPLYDTVTTMDLLPGEFELLELTVPLPMNAPPFPFEVIATVDYDEVIDECVEDNNDAQASCIVIG
ncbi:MAG: VCBS repeat-containing protein [Myxococcales bacterium]|nr:VCBS repeat-containing protein [Myxococcales bacterium]